MIFNNKPIQFDREPLFFGTGRNIARLDLSIDQEIEQFYLALRAQLWFPTDFSLKQDAADYANMLEPERLLFLKNLKFQTLLDSIAARTVLEVFLPLTTSPRLEKWWHLHGYTESIHSDSYAEIIKALPVDAKAIFDDIMINPDILNRAKRIVDQFNETVLLNAEYILTGVVTTEHRISLIKSLFSLNILEGGLFQSSFITSFSYAEHGIMEGTSKIIAKISNDEGVHCALSFHLLDKLRHGNDYRYLIKDMEEDIIEMYKDAHSADMIWADYLFPDNIQINGLNPLVLKQYISFNMNNLVLAVGLPTFLEKTFNPVTWSSKYTNLAKQQIAQNESDGNSYLLGVINKDVSVEDWNEIQELTQESMKCLGT